MDDLTTVRVSFDTVPVLLDMASEFLAFDQILAATTEPLEVGRQCRLIITLPVAGIDLSATGRVIRVGPQGAVLEILCWEEGHARALWYWVGLCREILRNSGVRAYQERASGPATLPSRAALRALLFARAESGEEDAPRKQEPQTVRASRPGEHRSMPRETVAGGATGSPPVGEDRKGRRSAVKGPQPRLPLSARGFSGGRNFVSPRSRYAFTVALANRPLPFVIDDIRTQGKTGWLELSGGRLSRRLGFYEGALVQVEQRPHVSVDFLANAVRAVGLDWRLVTANADRLRYSDTPEEVLISTGKMTQDQAERVLSRRLSVQLARTIDGNHKGEAGFLEGGWTHGPPALMPDPPVPLVRMIWDGSRAATFRRPRLAADNLRQRLLAGALRWVGRQDFPLEEATHRVEELDFILRCKEDMASVTSYLAAEGKDDRIALATLWSLLLLGFVEAQESVSGVVQGIDLIPDRPEPQSMAEGPQAGAGTTSTQEGGVSSDVAGDGERHDPSRPPAEVAGAGLSPKSGVDEVDSAPGTLGSADGKAAPAHAEAGSSLSPDPETAPMPQAVDQGSDSPVRPVSGNQEDGPGLLSSVGRAASVSPEEVKATESVPQDREELDSLLGVRNQLEQLNHFEVLGLSWSAHPDDIQPAYGRALKKFRAATTSDDPRVSEVAQAIIRRIVQAYEVLSNPATRRRYRELLMGAEVDAEVDRLMKEGGLHYMLERHAEALRCFERAADLAPDRDDVNAEVVRQRATMRESLKEHAGDH